MTEIGSATTTPSLYTPKRAPKPRDAAAASVKAPSLEPRPPVDAPRSAMFSPAAAKKHQISAQIAHAIHYAAQAARTTTVAVLETGSKLNVRA